MTELDEASLAQITTLLDTTTQLEGHAPIGEHKLAHLSVGAENWDGILAWDAGRLIGYAHLRWNAPGSDPALAAEVVVHPDRRDEGIQQQLLASARLTVARSGGGRMFLWVHRVEDAEETLAHRMGFRVQRELAFMVREDEEAPDPGPAPDGTIVRRYRGPTDDAAFVEVNNAAFPDHPENGGWSVEDFAERRSLPWFDPDGLFMAFDRDAEGAEGQPLGFHWTKWHTHDGDHPHEPEGEVYVLAVHPRAQGRGIGRHLLRRGLTHLAERSQDVVLYVDCASTGPVGLYESEGFRTRYREVCFVDDVAPAPRTPGSMLRPAD